MGRTLPFEHGGRVLCCGSSCILDVPWNQDSSCLCPSKISWQFSHTTRNLILDFWLITPETVALLNKCNHIVNLSSVGVKAAPYMQIHHCSENWLFTCWIQTSYVFVYLKQKTTLLQILASVSSFHGFNFSLFLRRWWDSLSRGQRECNHLPILQGCCQVFVDPQTIATGDGENSPLAQESCKIFPSESFQEVAISLVPAFMPFSCSR